VQFLSLQSVLPQGLEATADVVIGEARRINAHMVLIDGFRGMRSVDTEPQAAREFLYRIGTTLGALGSTTLVTSETDPRDLTYFPETTTADVIIGLMSSLGCSTHFWACASYGASRCSKRAGPRLWRGCMR
jgi:circadian clock protein KaiC